MLLIVSTAALAILVISCWVMENQRRALKELAEAAKPFVPPPPKYLPPYPYIVLEEPELRRFRRALANAEEIAG